MSELEKKEKSEIALREEAILAFWEENHIFEKSESGKDHLEEFIFYDGPPFATGLPHYGHILGGTMKDMIPRYKSMRGKRVLRRWGWDCHGLPLENLIEKELGLKTKKDIEDLGIGKFNEAARASVLRYEKEWKKIVPRLGRWVDMENSYKTMDASYSETIWWIFKNLYEKKLISKGFKSMHICPRCETTLSNFEVNQGYKDVKDISVYAKFELVDPIRTDGSKEPTSNGAGEPKTFVLAWTTTPWTLPGNAALAVNPGIEYVKVLIEGEKYILAKERLVSLKDKKYEVVETFSAQKLIGKKYKPLFDYYVNDSKLENKENAWKIYGADFVTTEDGTGVVHIAPAFGTDDYNLSKKENIPFIQHVGMDGKFKKEVTDFAGQGVKVKSEEDKIRFAADIAIIKYLQEHNTFFAKENITHSYPHCWRCETPLLNYATSSWFVKVPDIKEKLVAENRKIGWVPEDIKEGRFGKWLEGAPDWAISRSRYWGAPLPVWECKECEKKEVLGSIEELQKKTTRKNNYFLMRHGEGTQNLNETVSCLPEDPYHLTEKGKEEVKASAKGLASKKIDYIFVSDFIRTKETAEIVMSELGLSENAVILDPRLREFNIGVFQGKRWSDFKKDFPFEERFDRAPEGGETLVELKRRAGAFLFDIDSRYEGKNILVISHQATLGMLVATARGLDRKGICALRDKKELDLPTATCLELIFASYPHNADYELDFHRPYIDEVKFTCECGHEMKRVPEVFDCWFESGAMPYGQVHYPFENKKIFDPEKGIGFPADFIAEGLDQTRGWFYSMIVLGTALFGKTPYKNVVVNGIILAEDGRKMSKSLRNYPDPMDIVNKYGADALRYYLLSSPTTHAEDMNFAEKGVDEVMKKVIMRLGNVVSFYELYAKPNTDTEIGIPKSKNVLDLWILARLDGTIREITKHLELYELDRACWPILDFVDDLSTWYLRRSRDRFKTEGEDKEHALETLRYVLRELAKAIAPSMPFFAETIFQKMKGKSDKESVHLEMWPEIKEISKAETEILETMVLVRKLASQALEVRSSEGIKVRQPLLKLSVKGKDLGPDFSLILKEELNVKEVAYAPDQAVEVELDLTITPGLKEEGELRELMRSIQDFRKEKNLEPKDKISVSLTASKEVLALSVKFAVEIEKVCSVKFSKTEEGEFSLSLIPVI